MSITVAALTAIPDEARMDSW